ncbi:uncharacterized protein NKAPD1 [Rhinoraja longicauda]
MARIPMGKVLLRNVIRHTDAHNKIQEESEMWKIREKEKQASKMRFCHQRRKTEGLSGNRMRCDGYDEEDEEQKATAAAAAAAAQKTFTAQDERESRNWTKKLYNFEASDPNRWGHSGYKELYPEEFESESDQKEGEVPAANGEKPMHPEPLKLASRKRKRSSKTSKKKRKKKSRKKVRRKRSLQCSDSSSDSESTVEEQNGRKKMKAKKKQREKVAWQQKEQPCQSSDSGPSSAHHHSDTSSKDGSGSSSQLQKEKKRRKKKERRNIPKAEGDREIKDNKKKRKNWKIAPNDTSDESGDEELN